MFKIPGVRGKSHRPKATNVRFRVTSGAEHLFPNQTPLRKSLPAGATLGATAQADPAAILATSYSGTNSENPRVGGSIPPLATKNCLKFNRLDAPEFASKNLS